MNKENLAKKKEELTKSLQAIEQQIAQAQEQVVMHRGALQYNDMLMKELEAAEAAKEATELKAVPDAE